VRVGILGGTFDPIHFGHLRTAEEIAEALHLDRVALIPSAHPPHKPRRAITPFHHRHAMACLGAGPSEHLEVLDLEAQREGPSYTVDTLREMQGRLGPDCELFFILGTDAFLEISTWKEYRRLLELAHLVVIPRPGFDEATCLEVMRTLCLVKRPGSRGYRAPSGREVCFQKTTFLDISASRIRQALAQGRSIRFLVPESVHAYIKEKRLYGGNGNPG